MKKTIVFSIRVKIILAFVVAGFLSIGLLGGIIYNMVATYEDKQIHEKLKTTAEYVAKTMDVDA
ncbi:MAG: hypothetical protein H7X94_14515, partial [Vallitaleaceae bacterium]|nr:hypothetical protein [Vallitaleaceae bacterium]